MLSKDWTLSTALGVLRDKISAISLDDAQQLFLIDYLHLNICEVAKLLDPIVYQDYMVRVAVSPSIASPFYAAVSGVVIATSYDNTTKTVTKSAHGLSVGDTLIYWDDGGNKTFGYVVSTPLSSTFTVNVAIGATVTNFKYIKLPSLADTIDLSALRYDSIVKLSDSVLGLCIRKDFKAIENVLNSPQANSSIFYSQSGELLILKKGTNVSYGTLTLSYTRIPTKATADGDYLDIRDELVNLAINKTALAVYEKMKLQPPESLVGAVSGKLQELLGSTSASPEKQNPKTK